MFDKQKYILMLIFALVGKFTDLTVLLSLFAKNNSLVETVEF